MKRMVLSGIAFVLLMSLNGCWLFRKKQTVAPGTCVQGTGNNASGQKSASFGQYSSPGAVALFDENIGELESTEDFILAEHNRGAEPKAVEGAMVPLASKDKKADSIVVYFDYDSDIIRPDQQKLLVSHKKKIEEWAKQGKTVVFKGHACDWHGPTKPYDRSYNMHISNNRAMHVADACKLSQAQCKIFGVGNEEPVVFEQSKTGQAANRRVEIYAI